MSKKIRDEDSSKQFKMFIRPSSLFLPLALCLIVNLVSSQSICYWPDGSVAPSYAPCSTTSSISMCSYTPHADKCEPNGLILGTDGVYFRDACSDPHWSSPGCLLLCPWNSNTYATLTQCTDGSFCCGASNTTCCSSNQGVFVASNIASIISPTISTAPASQTSASGSIQPSTNKTAQLVTSSNSKSTQTSTTKSTQAPTASSSTSTFISTSTTNKQSPTQSATNSISATETQSNKASNASNASDSNSSTPSKFSGTNNLAIGLGAGLGVALLFTLGVALGCGAHFFLRKKRVQREMSELPAGPDQTYGGWNDGGVVAQRMGFQKQGVHGSTSGSASGTTSHELYSR